MDYLEVKGHDGVYNLLWNDSEESKIIYRTNGQTNNNLWICMKYKLSVKFLQCFCELKITIFF